MTLILFVVIFFLDNAMTETLSHSREKSINKVIGLTLELLRMQRNIDRAKLASLVNIPESELLLYEQGKKYMSSGMLYILARELRIKPKFFFDDVLYRDEFCSLSL